MRYIGTLQRYDSIFAISPAGVAQINSGGMVKRRSYGTDWERRPPTSTAAGPAPYERRMITTLSISVGPLQSYAVGPGTSYEAFRKATSIDTFSIPRYSESSTGTLINLGGDFYTGPWMVERMIANDHGDGTTTVDLDLRKEAAWEDDL